MKKYLASAAIIAAAMTPAVAQAGDLSISTGVDYTSEYVFRGTSLAEQAIQPFVEANKGNWTLGAWASSPVGTNNIGEEIDIYASYAFDLFENVSTDAGVTYYYYPDAGESLFSSKEVPANSGSYAGTYEIFGSLGFDNVMFAPSVTAYYDTTLENATIEASAGYTIASKGKTSIDLGATLGAVESDEGKDYQYGNLAASLGYALADNASAHITANYALSYEDSLGLGASGTDKSELPYIAVGISTGF